MSIFKGVPVAAPVEVSTRFSKAGKFLAVISFCFGLLNYSATAAPRVCVPPVAGSAPRAASLACRLLKERYDA